MQWFCTAYRRVFSDPHHLVLLIHKSLEIKIFIITFSVGSKIILAFEINLVKNSYLMQFYEINICHVMIFRIYIVYKEHEMIKIGNETTEKLQVLSQVLE